MFTVNIIFCPQSFTPSLINNYKPPRNTRRNKWFVASSNFQIYCNKMYIIYYISSRNNLDIKGSVLTSFSVMTWGLQWICYQAYLHPLFIVTKYGSSFCFSLDVTSLVWYVMITSNSVFLPGLINITAHSPFLVERVVQEWNRYGETYLYMSFKQG